MMKIFVIGGTILSKRTPMLTPCCCHGDRSNINVLYSRLRWLFFFYQTTFTAVHRMEELYVRLDRISWIYITNAVQIDNEN